MELTRVIFGVFKRIFLFLSILLIACQGMQRTIAPADRVVLRQGGPHTGIWEPNTIYLEYQYYKLAGEFKLSVQVKAKNKVWYDGFRVYVLFVDAGGRVLERKEVAVYRVDNTYKMPPEATYISFHASTYRRPTRYKPANYR